MCVKYGDPTAIYQNHSGGMRRFGVISVKTFGTASWRMNSRWMIFQAHWRSRRRVMLDQTKDKSRKDVQQWRKPSNNLRNVSIKLKKLRKSWRVLKESRTLKPTAKQLFKILLRNRQKHSEILGGSWRIVVSEEPRVELSINWDTLDRSKLRFPIQFR